MDSMRRCATLSVASRSVAECAPRLRATSLEDDIIAANRVLECHAGISVAEPAVGLPGHDQLTSDPAGFVQQRYRKIAKLLSLRASPSDFRLGLRCSLDMQARLGVAERRRRLLSRAEASQLRGALLLAPSAVDQAEQVSALQERFGAYFQSLRRELLCWQMPERAHLLAWLPEQTRRSAVARLMDRGVSIRSKAAGEHGVSRPGMVFEQATAYLAAVYRQGGCSARSARQLASRDIAAPVVYPHD